MAHKFKSAYYVMTMWQTGNVGSRNIAKVEGQPKEGFKSENDALVWMIDCFGKEYYHNSFSSYTIMVIYEPIKD